MTRLTNLRCSISFLALIATPSVARAQAASTVPPDTAAPPTATTSDQTASPAESTGLQDIVVTAQRRSENLQRAAIAVSAVAGDQLVRQSITQSTDLSRLFPAIQIQPASSYTQIYLRGVGTFGANSYAENSVAFNLDGVYLSRPAAPSGLFYDLERIEVLKGPQGTLYGRNATGGAINIITAKPKLDRLDGYVNAEYGNYNTVKSSGAVNLPVGNAAALRIAGQVSQHDGYFSDGSDDERTRAVRGQLLVAPAGSRYDLTISVDYAHLGGVGGGGTIVPLVDGQKRLGASDPRVQAAYQSYAPTPPVPQIVIPNAGSQDNRFFGASATFDADLGFAKLTVIPAYRWTHYDVTSMSGGFVLDIDERSHQSSIEARLASQRSGPFTWVFGGYYFDERVHSNQDFNQASNRTLIASALRTHSAAAFGQATYSILSDLRLTGGIRYTSDTKEQNTVANTIPFVGFVPGVFPLKPIFVNVATTALTDKTFNKVTWKAGIEYDIGPKSLLYASASTGYKSGVLFPALSPNNISKPETLTAYTLGSKNRFLDNRLQLNFEGFYWKYKDQQISHLGPVQAAPGVYAPVFITDNAGSLTIYGVETEGLFRVTPNDLLSVNVQYLHSNYDSLRYQFYSTSGVAPAVGCPVSPTSLAGTSPIAKIYDVNCTGRSGINAPKWTVNLGYERTFELNEAGRIRFGVNSRLQSARYLTIDYLAAVRQGSFTKTDLQLTYETKSGQYAITAYVNNIEDNFTYSGSVQSPVKSGVFYNRVDPPRIYGVRGSVRF